MYPRLSRAVQFFFLFFLFLPSFSFASLPVKAVDWNDLKDRNVSADGRTALQMNRDAWKHAETEHFIYHFRDEKQAETVLVHAEAYYQWIKDVFGVASDPSKVKCQVYIFEDKALWEEFKGRNL